MTRFALLSALFVSIALAPKAHAEGLPSYLQVGISGEEMDAADDAAFRAASDAAAAAPDFCAVVYVESDATHRYRAVCELETEPADPCESFELASGESFEVCIGPIEFASL